MIKIRKRALWYVLGRLSLAVLAALAVELPASIVAAQTKPELGDGPLVDATLVAETQSIVPGQALHIALHQVIKPGWHTYWINPGDAGLPTTLEWQLPHGFTAGPIIWPTPLRIEEGPLVVYGYEDDTLLPLTIEVPKTLSIGATVTLTARARWLVCSDVCIPEDANLSISLPVATGSAELDPRWAENFKRARAATPVQNPFPTKVTIGEDGIVLNVASGDAAALREVVFFPSDGDVIDIDKPQKLQLVSGGLALMLPRSQPKAAVPPRLNGVLTFRDLSSGGGGTPQAILVSAPIDASGAASDSIDGLLEAILLGILGGIVLNLMPCVLPILSIKALSLAKQAHSESRTVRLQGFVYAAGVLSSFAAVAGVLLVLRSAGLAVGWGFQLQSPVFVTVMIYILFAVGLNLSGVFTISGQFTNVGGDLAAREGYSGSFFTGALATLVATPCTAPFMATAIGYGVTHPWYMSLGVFEAIGFGLALPYVLLSLSPTFRRLLPKPGAWMNRLKQVLAFPVYGTAVWLSFVLSEEASSIGIAVALAGLVLIAFAAWLYDAVSQSEGRARQFAIGISALALVGAFGLLGVISNASASSNTAASTGEAGLGWQAFSQAKLDTALAEGKPVFVDFTADWCITCKVNERIALNDPMVRDAFAAEGIVALKADWTRRSAEITHILEMNGRGGIPLYLFYPRSAASSRMSVPRVLPQILTAENVLSELRNN